MALASPARKAENAGVPEPQQEFLSILAHELRNPLNAISAAARVISRDVAGKPSEHLVRGIVEEVQHALELIDGLNDAVTMESGRMRLEFVPTDLVVLLRDVVASTPVDDRSISLAIGELPARVRADPGRLAQVVRNLLTNAVKYSPAGTEIEVGLDLAGGRAVVAVRDHGPGVPPEERERLFQKFARLSTAGGTRGSGLGLYISRGIVQDHGGDLWADWPPEGGSTFRFAIALAEA